MRDTVEKTESLLEEGDTQLRRFPWTLNLGKAGTQVVAPETADTTGES